MTPAQAPQRKAGTSPWSETGYSLLSVPRATRVKPACPRQLRRHNRAVAVNQHQRDLRGQRAQHTMRFRCLAPQHPRPHAAFTREVVGTLHSINLALSRASVQARLNAAATAPSLLARTTMTTSNPGRRPGPKRTTSRQRRRKRFLTTAQPMRLPTATPTRVVSLVAYKRTTIRAPP